jgi:hypothetical protein
LTHCEQVRNGLLGADVELTVEIQKRPVAIRDLGEVPNEPALGLKCGSPVPDFRLSFGAIHESAIDVGD